MGKGNNELGTSLRIGFYPSLLFHKLLVAIAAKLKKLFGDMVWPLFFGGNILSDATKQ